MSVLDGADVPSSDQLHSNGCSPNKWKSCVSSGGSVSRTFCLPACLLCVCECVCVRARGSLIEGTNPLT
jgi:hypothetical protein